ncbi:MAG: SAM-dependent methyltransferase [Citromicrobium sp.]|nr:MAG: SAM-dependent methyltransferase [Citromicrobium sp.]
MKRHSPAAARNAGPIAEVLARELPASGLVLEIASGSGEHAVFNARRFPELTWQPSDQDAQALESIGSWAEETALENLLPPIEIDVRDEPWPVELVEAALCINMVHISPWSATVALFNGASAVLAAGGPLLLYGPYFEQGIDCAPSNLAFDADLKRRNPEWGLREVSQVDDLAHDCGFRLTARYEMPANNLMLVYRKI